jgi:ABC-type transport system substrate-binding protein
LNRLNPIFSSVTFPCRKEPLMTWRIALASLVLASVTLLAACAAPAAPADAPAAGTVEAAPGEPVRGGAVIVGSPQEPGVLSPLLASSSIEDAISSLTI